MKKKKEEVKAPPFPKKVYVQWRQSYDYLGSPYTHFAMYENLGEAIEKVPVAEYSLSRKGMKSTQHFFIQESENDGGKST